MNSTTTAQTIEYSGMHLRLAYANHWLITITQVHLCGSFTRWVETVPMAPVEGQPSVFSVIVHLPPGYVDHGCHSPTRLRTIPPRYHQYKFIVDGEWRHDETQPYMPDPLGNVNNWLFVRRPDSTPTPNAYVATTARWVVYHVPHCVPCTAWHRSQTHHFCQPSSHQSRQARRHSQSTLLLHPWFKLLQRQKLQMLRWSRKRAAPPHKTLCHRAYKR